MAKDYRYRKWQNKHFKKNVKSRTYNLLKKSIDKTGLVTTKKLNINKLPINSWTTCHFCGQKGIIVEEFNRRGYK